MARRTLSHLGPPPPGPESRLSPRRRPDGTSAGSRRERSRALAPRIAPYAVVTAVRGALAPALRWPGRDSLAWLAGAAAFAALVGLLLTYFMARTGEPIDPFVRDMNAIAGQPFYYGLVENIGIAVWVGTSAATAFTAFLYRVVLQQRVFFRFLLAGGAMSGILAMDDFFMLHEAGYSYAFGVGERRVYAGYGVGFLVFLGLFARTILSFSYGFLALACLAFAAAILMDVAPQALGLPGGAEEGFEFLGLLFWSVFWLKSSADTVALATVSAKAKG